MFASSVGSEHRDGATRVVPETGEIVSVCLEGEFDLGNVRELRDEIDRALDSGNHWRAFPTFFRRPAPRTRPSCLCAPAHVALATPRSTWT